MTAKEEVTVIKRMYMKLSERPTASERPIPPFRLRAESDTPISVKIKEAGIVAMRL